MIYSLVVMSSPASGQSTATAARFAQAALAAGHKIHRAFFLDDGTYTGSANGVHPQDETERLQPWLELAETQGVELVLCISSALRRGLLDEAEANRYDKAGATAHPAFIVSGLGQLVDAAIASDRLITFGG